MAASQDEDGEDLSDSEELSITVDFLKFKSSVVLRTLKKIIPRDLRDTQGMTLLHWAARKGQLDKVKFIVEAFLSTPNAVNAEGENALELASRAGFANVIQFLTSLGLPCEVKDPRLRLNPSISLEAEKQLSAAIYADNLEIITQVWTAYVVNLQGRFSIPEHYEWTALEMAGNFLSPRALEFLVMQGCSLASVSRDSGFTPIRTILSTYLSYLPPETDQEWVMTNVGTDCVLFLFSLHLDLSDYSHLLRDLKDKLSLVGVHERASSEFERDVTKKVDRLRLSIH